MLRVFLYLFFITICLKRSRSSVVPQEETTVTLEIRDAYETVSNANETVSNANETASTANESVSNASETVFNASETVPDANENNGRDEFSNNTVQSNQFKRVNLKGDNFTSATINQDNSEETTTEDATTEYTTVKNAPSAQALVENTTEKVAAFESATEEVTTEDPVEDISELITGARNPIARVLEGVNSGFKDIADRASEAGRNGIHFMQHAGASILDGF